MQDVVEHNLEQIMVSSEVHDHVEVMACKKKEEDDLNKCAKQITFEMKGKAEARREMYLKE